MPFSTLQSKTTDFTKRAIDILFSATGLVILSPLLFLVALLIRLAMGSPVIFRQKRPGLYGKPFEIYKFRTMNLAPEDTQHLIPDKERVTPMGKLLRSYSLDELPQLWNLLKGDLSLVGPRPLLQCYYPYYSERERKRFLVRPGITGWAQINGRCNLPWDERLEMDVWYVENFSLLLDLKIVGLTLVRVLKRENACFEPSEELRYNLDIERQMRGSVANDKILDS